MSSLDPFFIVCDSRSGSTLLANWIVKGNAVIPPETNFVPELLAAYGPEAVLSHGDVSDLLDIVFADPKFGDLDLSRGAVDDRLLSEVPMTPADAIRAILQLYRENADPAAVRIGIKKGSYLYHWQVLVSAFPQSRFVGLRDGRSVFASKRRSIYSRTGKPFETDPLRAARRWQSTVRLLRELEQEHPHTLVIRYEDLILNSQATLRRVLRHIDVGERSGGSASDYVVPARYGTRLHQNIESGPLSDRIVAWRSELSDDEVVSFESIAGSVLEAEGYELSGNGGGKR